MIKISRKDLIKIVGPMIVGPIPEGVIPEDFVKSQGEGSKFCIHLFPKIKVMKNSLYPRVMGSFWIVK